MLENALVISLVVILIHLMLQDDEIFGVVGKWFKQHLPEGIHKPVFSCPICMTPWWGSIVMAVAVITGIESFQHIDIWHWLFILAIAGGICTVYVEMKPKKEIKLNEEQVCGTTIIVLRSFFKYETIYF